MAASEPSRRHGGIVHTYRKYDPKKFPLPDASPPDLVTPAFEHMLAFGSLRHLSPEQLADAIEIDPSQIRGLGPSIESLRAMLEERKRRILQTYETLTVRGLADRVYRDTCREADPPDSLRDSFAAAVHDEQIVDFERLWYQAEADHEFAGRLMRITQALGDKYQVEELASAYDFTGREPMDVPHALAIKEELELIDKLLAQLDEAAKNARLYVIDMEALAEFASDDQMSELQQLQHQINQLLETLAAEQGLRFGEQGFELTPAAFRVFQTRLLDRIFGDLQAAKSGRHQVEITGDGAVEMQRTKPYEFGDSLAHMDIGASMTNALIRNGAELPIRLRPSDIEIHQTRNTPKCATVVCMDMSGSMRWGGLYVHVKRMALALHGLIRTDYPGDFVDFVEIATLPKRRHISQVPELLPKPVTLRDPVVRLMADMSDANLSEQFIPPHFTNIQHGLQLARHMLQVQDTPNRQIILITDGLPTAHFESHELYLLYPPDPRTERHTLREGMLCKEQGIVINIFLLSTWAQSEEDVRFAHRLAENTKGRVFFVAGAELERFVVWDYLNRRRLIIG